MLVCISVSLMPYSVTVCVSLHVCLLVYMHSSAHTSLCIHTSVKKRDKESECLSVCAGVCKRQKMVCVCVCGCVCRERERETAGCRAAELKALELTGCMPGPPSHLHHPALLFSWVAGLITDPRWHVIARAHTDTGAHAHTHTYRALPHILSFYPSLSLLLSFFHPSFFPVTLSHSLLFLSPAPSNFFFFPSAFFFLLFFLCHSVTFCSLAPGTFYLSFSVSLSPVLLFLMLLSFSDIFHSLQPQPLLPPLSLSCTPTFVFLSD